MAKGSTARRSLGAGALTLLAGLLAACGARVGGPAPVISGEASAESQMPPAEIVVRRGQTLSGIAEKYHVPMRALAEANRLAPPYRIAARRTLVIPGAGAPAPAEAPVAVAALPPSGTPAAARPVAPDFGRPRPVAPDFGRPRPVAPERWAAPAPPIAGAAAPSVAAAPAPRLAETLPPPAEPARHAPAPASASPEPARHAPEPSVAAAEPPREPPAESPRPAEPPRAPPSAAHGGEFLWPVRGRVLESYGAGPNGTRNDGINIAAPRGAAVEAADAGVVAYAGNELRGYGNLILVKHAKGWISAYAHCDLILVKTGQKVARGQVIGRVGSSGNVSEPQLHFELRRGKHPVDPTDYLAPLPTAATRDSQPG